MFEIKKGQLFLKILGFIALGLFAFVVLNTCSTVSNRAMVPITETTWVSRVDKIRFNDEEKGIYYTPSGATPFTYEYENGYILCESGNVVILELTHIQDDRMLCVNNNVMYYNEASL